MNKQTIGDRLRSAMGPLGENELARRSGVPQSTIHRILNHQSTEPRRSNVDKIARALEVDTEWLLTGTELPVGEVPAGASIRTYRDRTDLNEEDYVWVDRYDVKVSAGNGNAAWVVKPKDPICFRAGWFKHKGLSPDNCKAIYVRGRSMEPKLEDNDTILIDTNDLEPVEGEIYALVFKNTLYVKTFTRTSTGDIELKSENPEFKNITVPENEHEHLKILGRKVWRGG